MATKKAPAKAKTASKSTARKVKKASEPKKDLTTLDLSDTSTQQEFIQGLQEAGVPISPQPQAYDPKWHAKLEAYAALQNAGVPIPNELAGEVEGWLAQEQAWKEAQEKAEAEKQAEIQKDNETGPVWVRNAYPAPFSLRLERQSEKKRIELKPRGQRGDMFPLEPGDEHDQVLITNLNTGLIEIIPNGEAKAELAKQTHNLQRRHTPLAVLTNELGEKTGQMKLHVEQEYNKQGIVVAYENPNVDPNNPKATNRAPLGGLVRPEQVQHFVPTGGHPANVQTGPVSHLGQEAKEKIADDIARRKGVQGRPEDVLGLAVTVDPVQRS